MPILPLLAPLEIARAHSVKFLMGSPPAGLNFETSFN